MTRISTSYRLQIVLLLSSAQALAYIDRVNLSVVGPSLIKTAHYTPALLGILFSIFNWAFTLSLLAAGPFTDKVRARIAFPSGMSLWSIATMFCAISSAFASLALFRGIVGIGEAPMIPAGSRVIREVFEKEWRATVVGAFFAGNKIGLTLGIPLASFLFALTGWAGVFIVTGGLGFIWLAWWLAVYRHPVVDRSEPPSLGIAIRWSALLRYRTTWGIMIGQAGYLYIFYVFATWLPGYLILQRHMSLRQTGVVGMLPFLVATFCVVLGGWCGDKLIAAGHGVTRVRKSFAVGGLLAATIFTIAGAYAHNTVAAIILLTLAVAGYSFSTASINSMPIDVAPNHIVSSLVSLQNFGGNVGGSFAPIVTGFLISASGNFSLPLLVAALVALVLGCGGYGFVVGNLDEELRAPIG